MDEVWLGHDALEPGLLNPETKVKGDEFRVCDVLHPETDQSDSSTRHQGTVGLLHPRPRPVSTQESNIKPLKP